MNKKLQIYFFGQIGVYDEESPEYILNEPFVSEILYIIAKHEPFSIKGECIAKELKLEYEILKKIIANLEHIGLIDVTEDTYKIKFPVFLEEDLEIMDETLLDIGKVIGDIIISKHWIIYEKIKELSSYEVFGNKRLLYHILCDRVFDGTALEYFGEQQIFCISKKRPGNRDYLVIGYECSKIVDDYSNKLLCSSNNYRSHGFTFNSFGDGNGDRKDMYRFFRKSQVALEKSSKFTETNLAYIEILEAKNREIAGECGRLLVNILTREIHYEDLSYEDKSLLMFLRELDYVHFDDNIGSIICTVPVFYKEDLEIISEISSIILSDIHDTVKNFFQQFECRKMDITSIRHKVDIKEIANEMWHQVFGNVNEYLIQIGFVASPHNIEGDGRYMRSISVEN